MPYLFDDAIGFDASGSTFDGVELVVRELMPPVTAGPPMGAPWNPLPRLFWPQLGSPAGPDRADQQQALMPMIVRGPALFGAPWGPSAAMIGILSHYAPAPPPPGDPQNTTRLPTKPFLPRVPKTDDPRRLARFTELLSSFFNSLVHQGIISQQEAATWTLRPGGIVSDRPPTADDDRTTGVVVGVTWVDQTAGAVYICTSNEPRAATWNGPL